MSRHETGYWRHLRACNDHDLSRYRPLLIGGVRIGWVPPALARRLADFPDAFAADGEAVRLARGLDDFDARTAAVGAAVERLAEAGDLPPLRDEDYPVVTRWGDEPLLRLDRTAVTALGMLAFGVHVNGHVETADGLELWVGRRAKDRKVAPGKLDNLVGGGQPFGLTLEDNLVKECHEEAGLTRTQALAARPAGAVAYAMATPEGLRRDLLFCYDLALAGDFAPESGDGEVERFERWPLDRVAATIRDTDEFKFNVPLVIIAFLIRRGWLTPDEPEYPALATGLAGGVPAP